MGPLVPVLFQEGCDKMFKTRLIVSIGLVLVLVAGALTPNALGLRVVFALMLAMAILELAALAAHTDKPTQLPLFMVAVVGFAAISTLMLPKSILILSIALAYVTDAAAYVFGRIFGGLCIKARPFPKISPKKSFEGCVGGLIMAAFIWGIGYSLLPPSLPLYALSAGGLLAILGDAMESATKRVCGVKDSCDILGQCKGFRHIEKLFGGSKGHGGFLDRIDSPALLLTVAFFLQTIQNAITA